MLVEEPEWQRMAWCHHACPGAPDLCCRWNGEGLPPSVPFWGPKHDFGWNCLRGWFAVLAINLAFPTHLPWFLLILLYRKWFLMDLKLSAHLCWMLSLTDMPGIIHCRCWVSFGVCFLETLEFIYVFCWRMSTCWLLKVRSFLILGKAVYINYLVSKTCLVQFWFGYSVLIYLPD